MVDQPIAAAADCVRAAMLDPDLYRRLGRVSPIRVGAVLADVRDERSVAQRIRLWFAGSIDPPASSFVDRDKLTWVQETVTDLGSGRTQVRAVPDCYGRLLSFEAWYDLRAVDSSQTVQHFEGDLRVHVLGLGPLAERGIGRGLREHLALTAGVLEELCAGAPGPGASGL